MKTGILQKLTKAAKDRAGLAKPATLLAMAMTMTARAATVDYYSQTITGSTNNRSITISQQSDPLAISTNLVFSPQTFQPTNGHARFTLLPGNYWLKIDQVSSRQLFAVPDSTNTYNIIDLINRGLYVLSASNTNGLQYVTGLDGNVWATDGLNWTNLALYGAGLVFPQMRLFSDTIIFNGSASFVGDATQAGEVVGIGNANPNLVNLLVLRTNGVVTTSVDGQGQWHGINGSGITGTLTNNTSGSAMKPAITSSQAQALLGIDGANNFTLTSIAGLVLGLYGAQTGSAALSNMVANVFTTNAVGANGVLNAPIGTAAYSNATAFLTQAAVGTAAYSNSANFQPASAALSNAVQNVFTTNAVGANGVLNAPVGTMAYTNGATFSTEETNRTYNLSKQWAPRRGLEVDYDFSSTWNTNPINTGAAQIPNIDTGYPFYVAGFGTNFAVGNGRLFANQAVSKTAVYMGWTTTNTPTVWGAKFRVISRGAGNDFIELAMINSTNAIVQAPGNNGVNVGQAIHCVFLLENASPLSIALLTNGVGTGNSYDLSIGQTPSLYAPAANYATSPIGNRTTTGANTPDLGEIFDIEFIHTPAMGNALKVRLRNQTVTITDPLVPKLWGNNYCVEFFPIDNSQTYRSTYEVLEVWSGVRTEDFQNGQVTMDGKGITNVQDAALSSNVAFKNGTNTFTGTNTLGGKTIVNGAGTAATVVNLGLDANNNVTTNASAVGGGGGSGIPQNSGFGTNTTIYGDSNKTNAFLVAPNGVTVSNAQGYVNTAGGNLLVSGNITSTNGQFNGNGAGITNKGYQIPLLGTGNNSPVANTTYYFGNDTARLLNTTYAISQIDIPVGGTIKRVQYKTDASGTLGTAGQAVGFAIFLNNATAVGSTNLDISAALTNVVVSGLSQAVSAGDTIVLRVVTPVTWTTTPTNLRLSARVWIE